MAAIKYKVALTEAERSRLNEVSQRGKASVRTVSVRCRCSSWGLRDREIVLLVNPATVATRHQCWTAGRKRTCAFACSAAPEGHTHWTLQLLADKVVELEFAESISLETVRQILKKTIKPWKKKEWCIPKVTGSSWRGWRTCWTCTNRSTIRSVR